MNEVLEFRQKHDMNQDVLAFYMNVTRLTITNWETRRKKMSKRNYEKFLEFKNKYESGEIKVLVDRKQHLNMKMKEINNLFEKDGRFLEMVYAMMEQYKKFE